MKNTNNNTHWYRDKELHPVSHTILNISSLLIAVGLQSCLMYTEEYSPEEFSKMDTLFNFVNRPSTQEHRAEGKPWPWAISSLIPELDSDSILWLYVSPFSKEAESLLWLDICRCFFKTLSLPHLQCFLNSGPLIMTNCASLHGTKDFLGCGQFWTNWG